MSEGESSGRVANPRRGRWPWWWETLSSWGRVSIVGLAAAGLLAVGLGVYIPRQVEVHMLQALTDSNRQVLQALLGSRMLPVRDPESGFEELDGFVSQAILRGDFVRVKLWSPDGRIIYSDDRRLVGRTFPRSAELEAALAGGPQSELSDLSDRENQLERGLADRLLEFYLPVERDGRVVAVWEVYQSLDRFEYQLSRVRVAVWVSVASGLAVLLLFLVSSFGSLFSVIHQRRQEAEARSRDLSLSRDEQRRLTRRLVTAHEEERKRIVGEVHDGLGQDLHRVLFGLRGCRGAPPGQTSEELERLEEVVAGSIGGLGRLLHDLRPSTLEDVGLGAALRGLTDRLKDDGLRVELRGNDADSPELPLAARVTAFRIIQEALMNVLKHSASRRAVVQIQATNGTLGLRVADEGHGLPPEPGDGLGLWLMRERAESVGGTLSVDSGPAGTVVSAALPLEAGR